ncbi:MAG: single-stranded DNA-binding protein [Phycisphaerales bacterium]|nr:single-stranded DNA-binding protein [Phycisphaerales bacterium]
MSTKLIEITDTLSKKVRRLEFASPVAYVYNPLEYAQAPHRRYVKRFGRAPREVVLVGMNPGPWGMAQTGVPFGEINLARDWLGLEAPVEKPRREHPKRPVEGFDCRRSEVSGRRLWGWARDTFETPQRFFERFYIANYCPLCFMEDSGRNRTPDKLPVNERDPLFQACDRALRATVEYLKPRFLIGIGAFAEARAHIALDGLNVTIGRILHPSPASPLANRDWAGQAAKALNALGIEIPKPRSRVTRS